MQCICPCLSLPCCVLSLCPLGAGPTGEFTPRATSEVHKGPSDNDAAPRPLRAFLALCCACVCATAQEEGQYDVAVVEAGEGQDQTTTTTTTTTQLTTTTTPPMHPPRTTTTQGTDSWRRERPRRPFVGSGAAAAACQCRCGDRRCCVLRTGRGACAALGVTHREVRRVYLSTCSGVDVYMPLSLVVRAWRIFAVLFCAWFFRV
ncbi:putative mucin TcSMUGS [Trypanosoma cruzi]|uniref:Putative mucin TcSMUGS n=1 Tax=Trypanosoma cruzi TaxID=5693 RepID=A0A2V2V0P5_TRYCR|nr:putative mucin TcSMUGS [Trypanosoma cruzi]